MCNVRSMTTLPPNISPGKAAKMLTKAGIPTHPNAVRRWAAQGHVRSIRTPSGRYLVELDQIQDIIAGHGQDIIDVRKEGAS